MTEYSNTSFLLPSILLPLVQNVTYDDRDPILNYSPGWFRTGTYNASSIGETGTLASSSITTGVNVTFVFPIPATEFYYFGIKRSHGGSYLICIDCDPNDRQFETINAVDITDDGKNPPVVLFSRKFPEPGVHEVILMNQPDINFGGNSQITLDKFQLLVPEAVQTVLSSSPAPTISTSATDLDQTGSSSSHNSILVPVLAGVLGGLAILLILLGIWLLMRRKSRRPLRSEEQPSDYQSESSENLWPTSTSRFTAFTDSTTSISAPTVTTTSRRELDAGRIDNYLSPIEDTLPPEYGQVFRPASRAPPPPGFEPSSPEQPVEPDRALPKSMR